jgi:hypothetical protein
VQHPRSADPCADRVCTHKKEGKNQNKRPEYFWPETDPDYKIKPSGTVPAWSSQAWTIGRLSDFHGPYDILHAT